MQRWHRFIASGALAALLIGLNGCGILETSPDPAAQARQAQARQERLAVLKGRCVGYGFEFGTPQMAECVERLDMQARADSRRKAICQLEMSAAMNQPTRTGSFGESMDNANAALAKCMARP